ncbi:TetR/AcrR family transcriptional regulator [Sphingomonas sp. URHD0057]|uniref:TetR/AcrR family transcriptional regulator n=1 Tax=Sphingomonas sp. URHD0057 TaxID=1380389 RepID=UPI00048A46C8|nr:TetR/AcrR family transcriptional regulator [Sphingomonas sp. URHD0057]
MGRRSDHSRTELRELIVAEGHRQMAEHGFARFSARQVARAIGYSIGTIYNLFPTLDRLIVAINTRTITMWTAFVGQRLDGVGDDRIGVLVRAYFEFASEHTNLWMAIYDHRLPAGMPLPPEDDETRRELTLIVVRELAALLPHLEDTDVERLARSLIATVHGHCTYALNGSFELMGEVDPVGLALDRVREAIAAAKAG